MPQQGTGQYVPAVEDYPGRAEAGSAGSRQQMMNFSTFNQGISRPIAMTMEHLSNFVFISMANLTLARRDAYLAHLRYSIKPDTPAA